MFAEFEEEYKSAVTQLEEHLKALRATIPEKGAPPPTTVGSHARGDKVLRLQKLVVQVKDLVANMDMECNVLLPKERAASKSRVDEYRKKTEQFAADFEKLKQDSLTADRAELMAVAKHNRSKSTDGAPGSSAVDMQAQLAAASIKTTQSTKKLREAERLTVEMNETADNTLTELERQRRTVQSVAGKVADVDEELTQIQRILRQMHRTLMKNKAVMAAIILLLIVMIIGLLYYKFGTSSSSTTTVIAATPPPPLLLSDAPELGPARR